MRLHTDSVFRPHGLATSSWLIRVGLFIGLLAILLVPSVTIHAYRAYAAAPLEDCDGDGYDDATGVSVPWPGYDETHGDTAAGPGTAGWWIEQNKPKDTGGGDVTPGAGTSEEPDRASASPGGRSSSGDGRSNSGGGGDPSTGGTNASVGQTDGTIDAAGAQPTPSAAPAGATSAGAPGSAVTSTPVSAATSVSAESSRTAAPLTADQGSPSATNRNLWDALTAGFTSNNKEFSAGLGLLGGLVFVGGLSLSIHTVRGLSDRHRPRENSASLVEAPTSNPV